MSHSTNLAAIEMLEKGAVSSASIMMPCPWVSEFAEYARKHPEKDLGLHLTLTSEWRNYRWGPVAARDKVTNLVDPSGFLWRSVAEVAMRASPEEIETELRAQIEKAKRMGIRFTHFDTHMGTLYARPDYFEVFEKLGREYGIPILRVKPSSEAERSAPRPMIDYLLKNEDRYKREGFFRLDSLLTDPARGTTAYADRKAALFQSVTPVEAGYSHADYSSGDPRRGTEGDYEQCGGSRRRLPDLPGLGYAGAAEGIAGTAGRMAGCEVVQRPA
jgi:predicted glycoside hydrolase/deacetylase ChbG (UPF0249 family)